MLEIVVAFATCPGPSATLAMTERIRDAEKTQDVAQGFDSYNCLTKGLGGYN